MKSETHKLKTKALLCAIGVSMPLSGGAAVIVEYTFPLVIGAVSQPTTATATTIATDVSASLFSVVGAGSNFSAGTATTGSTSSTGNVFLNRANTPTSRSASDHYFQFTVTPGVGKKLNLTSLNFFYGDAQAETTETNNLALYTSVDSYASQVGGTLSWAPATTIVDRYFTTASGVQYATIDLTGAAFQNLATATTFRIFGWDSTNTGGQLRIDDVRLNGAVVPEPSAALLGGLGTLVLLRRRRQA